MEAAEEPGPLRLTRPEELEIDILGSGEDVSGEAVDSGRLVADFEERERNESEGKRMWEFTLV